MTAQERVQAVAKFGFTDRQAHFLVTVMRHAGVCLLRQYSTSAGIVHGQKTRAFFQKLVSRGHASAYTCRHNRGRVYHVHFYPLYKAIGQPHSRHRRPVAAGRVAERLLLLDAVLASPDFEWLTSRMEKVRHFDALSPPVPVEHLPRAKTQATTGSRHVFPDEGPIGIDPSGRVVLLYLVSGRARDDFRLFLRRHAALLRCVPTWTLTLVFARALAGSYDAYQEIVREEWDSPLHLRTVAKLNQSFEKRRTAEQGPAQSFAQISTQEKPELFSPRVERLYQRWRRHGNHVLEDSMSSVLSEALSSGTGRVESLVLRHSYGHLSPLVTQGRSDSQLAAGIAVSTAASTGQPTSSSR